MTPRSGPGASGPRLSGPRLSGPRLSGPSVALVPAPHDVAVAALGGAGPALAAALAPLGLCAGTGWPHADTADALRPLAEHGQPGEPGTWLVCTGAEVVGECGWRAGPDAEGGIELHYGLASPSRGRGLGTEAVAVLAAWTEQQPGVRRLQAEVLVGNEPSLRLLRRLGFEAERADPPYVRFTREVGGTTGPTRRFAGRHVC
jgi:ribosomal-protein-alanine N-acetyltransferase